MTHRQANTTRFSPNARFDAHYREADRPICTPVISATLLFSLKRCVMRLWFKPVITSSPLGRLQCNQTAAYCCIRKGHKHNHAVGQDTSARRCVLQLLEGGNPGNRLHAAGKQGHEFVFVKCCERYLLCTILTPSLKGKATTSTLSSLMTYSLNSLIAMAILSVPPSGVYTRPCMKTHHCRVSLFTMTTAQETICN